MQKTDTIFISHRAAERPWVDKLARELRNQGAHVWIDQADIQFGADWVNKLHKGLGESDLLVVLIGRGEVSPAQWFEIGAALNQGKRIVAVLDRRVDPSEVPVKLRETQWLRMTTPAETASKLLAAGN